MDSEFSQHVGRSAERAWADGLYCAESVLLAIAQAHGVDSDIVPRIATGFCSGVARTNGMCGALAGAIMGVGLVLGRDEPGPVDACYDATAEVVGRFKDRFGASTCGDLLGCDLGTHEGQSMFKDQGLSRRCAEFTRVAAELGTSALTMHG